MATKIALRKPEVLAPARTLEKLKTSIHYGADAVYIGGNAYALRSRARNVAVDEMEEGVQIARKHNAKVYVAADIVTHEEDAKGAGVFFRRVREAGIDSVMVSDPALMQIRVLE